MKVEIYSDVACPWCYIGNARFERALAAFPGRAAVDVSFRPFQLDPGTPQRPQPFYEYSDQRFGPDFRPKHDHVTAVAAKEGLEFRFDRALAVNTFTAHRLLWLTERDHGAATQRALKIALLRTYFTDGGNIADTDTLVGLAAEVGVDRDRAKQWLTGDEGAAETIEEIESAQRLGIQAVPTFVFDGRYAVRGAQEASVLLQALEQVAAESLPATHGDDAACADGSCAV